ncbi:MAG TPA: hypothetical protein P5136_02680 [Methanofastidiosum sp.]|nr:hypothetical protein [Methanofastidiosum sp.]
MRVVIELIDEELELYYRYLSLVKKDKKKSIMIYNHNIFVDGIKKILKEKDK